MGSFRFYRRVHIPGLLRRFGIVTQSTIFRNYCAEPYRAAVTDGIVAHLTTGTPTFKPPNRTSSPLAVTAFGI
jgi:hypothetical protein